MKERRSLTASKVRQAKAEETRREAERLEGKWAPSLTFKMFYFYIFFAQR
jgi:hypothetical protein